MVTDSLVLRLIWAVVEETNSDELLALTDAALVRLLLQKVARRILLTGEEVWVLYEYISSRITLIRDMAGSRLN